jgi:hypothetical protein
LRCVDEDARADSGAAGKDLQAAVGYRGAACGPSGEHQFIAGGKDRVDREAARRDDLETRVVKTVLKNNCIAGGAAGENEL